jgi:hypothetical protein
LVFPFVFSFKGVQSQFSWVRGCIRISLSHNAKARLNCVYLLLLEMCKVQRKRVM